MTSQLPGVDIVKYLMAYCVVAIHFRANCWESGADWFNYPLLFDWLIKLAVPFFFMSSGYLLQRKLDSITDKGKRRETIFKRCRRLCRMWLVWNIIYLPFIVYYFHYNDIPAVEAIKMYVKLMLLNGGIYGSIPLWYIYSLFWVTLIVAIAGNFRYYRRWLFAGFMLLSFLIWLDPHVDSVIVHKIQTYGEHTLGGGLSILAGMLLYSFRGYFKPVYYLLLILLSVSMKIYGDLPYIPQIGACGLFGLSMLFSFRSDRMDFLGLRKQSMWIYFTHMMVIAIYFKMLAAESYFASPWISFVMVEAAAGILAYGLYRLQQTSFGRPLGSLL